MLIIHVGAVSKIVHVQEAMDIPSPKALGRTNKYIRFLKYTRQGGGRARASAYIQLTYQQQIRVLKRTFYMCHGVL